MKWRRFTLRYLGHLAVEFRRRGLVETRVLFELEKPDRFEQAQCSQSIHIRSVLRRFEADSDMALRPQIIHLMGLNFAQDAGQIGRVGKIAVVQMQAGIGFVRILIDVIDPTCVEERRASLDPMNLVALVQQELSQIRAVLSGDPCYECAFCQWSGP